MPSGQCSSSYSTWYCTSQHVWLVCSPESNPTLRNSLFDMFRLLFPLTWPAFLVEDQLEIQAASVTLFFGVGITEHRGVDGGRK